MSFTDICIARMDSKAVSFWLCGVAHFHFAPMIVYPHVMHLGYLFGWTTGAVASSSVKQGGSALVHDML